MFRAYVYVVTWNSMYNSSLCMEPTSFLRYWNLLYHHEEILHFHSTQFDFLIMTDETCIFEAFTKSVKRNCFFWLGRNLMACSNYKFFRADSAKNEYLRLDIPILLRLQYRWFCGDKSLYALEMKDTNIKRNPILCSNRGKVKVPLQDMP